MIAQKTSGKAYCNCLAIERGLSATGHADSFADSIIIEVPLPWKLDMMQKVGPLPEEVIKLLSLWMQEYKDGKGYNHRPMVVAPDPDYSKEGYRRVMFYTRQSGMIAQLEKVEYLVPEDQVGALAWALYQDRDSLPQFEVYRVPDAEQCRDILICTHGTVDAACAKFGFPLYKHIRDTYSTDNLRIWRVSHFGGHVFAPTLMDMPIGHYWAYVDKEHAERIVKRDGDFTAMHPYYRGWAGVEAGFLQTAEAELWQRHGWEWFDYHKSGEIIEKDTAENPQWAQIRFRYRPDDVTEEIVEKLRVEVDKIIDTEPSTDHGHTHPFLQYQVTGKTEV